MNKNRLLAGLLIALTAASMLYFIALSTRAQSVTEVIIPPGYAIERYVTGLSFPTAITWDESGAMYVSEAASKPAAGSSAGKDVWLQGRVLRVFPDPGAFQVVLSELNAPVTDVKIKDGMMYVAHKGCLSMADLKELTFEADKKDRESGADAKCVDLLKNLPSGDHFTGEIAFDMDGWIYMGNGTVTNSGVVGPDNFARGWVSADPKNCDASAKDIVLAGTNYVSLDPTTKNPFDKTLTGGFLPFGTESAPGQRVPAQHWVGGVIYRVKVEGGGVEKYAWGFRNPFGMGFAPSGQLIVADQGYQPRGSRPVANAPDPIYWVRKGAWYGWPDFASGEPVTDPKFLSPTRVVPAASLLREHPGLEKPILSFEPGTGLRKFGFAPSIFDTSQRMYISAFGQGDIACVLSAGRTLRHGIMAEPKERTGELPGSCVITLDTDTGEHEVFAYNRSLTPAGESLTGFNHPIDVKFGPDGSMFVVDFGVINDDGGRYRAIPGTGVIWKISVQRSELQIFREKCVALTQGLAGIAPRISEDQDGVPDEKPKDWDPEYEEIQIRVQEYVKGLARFGQEWGVFFKDLSSGKTFGINENLEVPAASTVKVAVVLYTSYLVSRGDLSWNEQLVYHNSRDWRGGAGIMQYTAKDGDIFTIRELAEKAIIYSDNVAWKMLERRLGIENLVNFMTEIGGRTVYPGGQNVSTPRDNATYMEAALSFSKSNAEGEKLMFDLANTVWNTGLNRYITEVEVAHKEGDIMGVADDVGVIYAEKPYVLSIMSKGHEDVEAGFEKIGEISRMIFDHQMGQIR